jgi:hypothetical protein
MLVRWESVARNPHVRKWERLVEYILGMTFYCVAGLNVSKERRVLTCR